MKTIAITMEEDVVDRLDKLLASRHGTVNRSLTIRQAVREYLEREERLAEEQREATIFRQSKARLARQAEALVKDQAKI
ncbi:MAG TPA: ribbon-helix-helix domain-containing protein [Terriglobia bacterium]|nr:ribbon-helix-helix domain-containing protein [Terriglobia bacterium]